MSLWRRKEFITIDAAALEEITREREREEAGQAQFISSDDAETSSHSDGSWGSDASPPAVSDNYSWPFVVGLAGISAFRVWVESRQEKERAQQEEDHPGSQEELEEPVNGGPAAGWYSVSSDVHELRYWDGSAWTDQFARVTDAASALPADWYPDPASGPSHLRFWDGSAWTNHVQAASFNSDWYPDPSDTSCLRWWDGATWTHHVRSRE